MDRGRFDPGERGRPVAERFEPRRDRLGWSEAGVVEVVAPAETLGFAVAEPAVEAERRDVERFDPRDQRTLLSLADEGLAILKPGDQRLVEQTGSSGEQLLELGWAQLGASWSNVHCRGNLSGRQRRKPVPWRKRRPVTWS